ncbi:MAG: Clp protease N-terminal domain-containing protein [Acidimicrobiales bacterium]
MASEVREFRELDGFGEAARRAVALAEVETRELRHDCMGTEHLLLGLLAHRESIAARALNQAGATLAATRRKVDEAVGRATASSLPAGALPTTARAGRALERAVRFSHRANADGVASTHLLLGVLDVEGRAGQVLRVLGVDIRALRAALDDVEGTSPEGMAAPPPAYDHRAAPATCASCGASANELVYRVMTVRGERQEPRDALVFSCGLCGGVASVTLD